MKMKEWGLVSLEKRWLWEHLRADPPVLRWKLLRRGSQALHRSARWEEKKGIS